MLRGIFAFLVAVGLFASAGCSEEEGGGSCQDLCGVFAIRNSWTPSEQSDCAAQCEMALAGTCQPDFCSMYDPTLGHDLATCVRRLLSATAGITTDTSAFWNAFCEVYYAGDVCAPGVSIENIMC
jgi:hypothetical protein